MHTCTDTGRISLWHIDRVFNKICVNSLMYEVLNN